MYVTCPPKQGTEGTEDIVGALSARLTEVLSENHQLRLQPVRKEVVHIQVPHYIDRPETMTEIVHLRKQIDSMNRQRLAIVADVGPQKTLAPQQIVTEKLVDKIVYKTHPMLVRAAIAAACASSILGVIIGRLLH